MGNLGRGNASAMERWHLQNNERMAWERDREKDRARGYNVATRGAKRVEKNQQPSFGDKALAMAPEFVMSAAEGALDHVAPGAGTALNVGRNAISDVVRGEPERALVNAGQAAARYGAGEALGAAFPEEEV